MPEGDHCWSRWELVCGKESGVLDMQLKSVISVEYAADKSIGETIKIAAIRINGSQQFLARQKEFEPRPSA